MFCSKERSSKQGIYKKFTSGASRLQRAAEFGSTAENQA